MMFKHNKKLRQSTSIFYIKAVNTKTHSTYFQYGHKNLFVHGGILQYDTFNLPFYITKELAYETLSELQNKYALSQDYLYTVHELNVRENFQYEYLNFNIIDLISDIKMKHHGNHIEDFLEGMREWTNLTNGFFINHFNIKEDCISFELIQNNGHLEWCDLCNRSENLHSLYDFRGVELMQLCSTCFKENIHNNDDEVLPF